jgi:5-formyltetrahydrofolate cyclo-ligase
MNAYFIKKEMREFLHGKRATIAPQDRVRMSDTILEKLLSIEEYKNCDTVLTYVSTDKEVDTFPLIAAALQSGKRVAVPRCVEGRPLIEFYYINSVDELFSGSYGLMEPLASQEKKCLQRNGLCVLPGLAFDRVGGRLGYGKGYYDRFLQNFRGVTVGICFSTILSERPLPMGRFDLPASIVITDKEIIRRGR